MLYELWHSLGAKTLAVDNFMLLLMATNRNPNLKQQTFCWLGDQEFLKVYPKLL